MNKETIVEGRRTFERVSKSKARKIYDEGQDIYLLPNHVRFDFNNHWIVPCRISARSDSQDSTKFGQTVANYEYYNCCRELGTYTKFFAVKEDK